MNFLLYCAEIYYNETLLSNLLNEFRNNYPHTQAKSALHAFFYKNTWFEFQPAVSYFSVYFQPKVFLILFLIFVFEFPEHSSVKT